MLATILPILTQAERESGRCRHRRSRLVRSRALNLTSTRPLPHETSTTVATRVAYWCASMIGSSAVT